MLSSFKRIWLAEPRQNPPHHLPPPTSFFPLLNFNQEQPSKNKFLWSNPYKIDVMITSHIEMLDLQKFDHMTTSTI